MTTSPDQDQFPPHIAEWLQQQLKLIEQRGNDILEAQLYTDADNVPVAAAGLGTISIAGFHLAADLAAHTDEPMTGLADILARHSLHTDNLLGEEAWKDVLLAALLYIITQHFEPALAILDGTDTPMRIVEQNNFRALHASTQTEADDTGSGER